MTVSPDGKTMQNLVEFKVMPIKIEGLFTKQ